MTSNASDAPLSIGTNSSISRSTDSDFDEYSIMNTPEVTIRRPIDSSVAPDVSHLIPNPMEVVASGLRSLATPVNARSTRELVRVNPIRTVRRRYRESRAVFSSIRRRLSMVAIRSNRSENHTLRALPRSKTMQKTGVPIELESTSSFHKILTAALEDFDDNSTQDSLSISSESANCARIREINRLEANGLATVALINGSEADVSEALSHLEWCMRHMTSEAHNIDCILENFEQEKRKKQKKLAQIEQILTVIREEQY